MTLFPRQSQSDFFPMFRLMDDWASHIASKGTDSTAAPTTLRSFNPRFDIKESKDVYELQGELPGIDQNNIDITFQDATTLAIRGRTEHTREQDQRLSARLENHEPALASLTNGEGKSNHQPTVEDEGETNGNTSQETHPEKQQQVSANKTSATDASKYWLSERSVGEFARTFSFPDRVNQDGVKASLRNGILSVVVPKAAPPVARKISIE